MTLPDVVFAALPPALAILLQRFPLPTDKYLAAKASERQAKAKLPPEASDMILETAKGALAVASFAPTLVSSIISAYALLYDRPDVREYALILLVSAIVIGLLAVSQLSRYAPFELSTTRLRVPLPFKRNILLPITWTGVINWAIYGINGLLIVLAVAKYFGRLPSLNWLQSGSGAG